MQEEARCMAEAMRAAGMQPQPSNYPAPLPFQQGQNAYTGQPFNSPTAGYPGQPFQQGQTAVPSNNLPNAIM